VLRVLVTLFHISLLVGTLQERNVVANWAVTSQKEAYRHFLAGP